MTVVPVTQAKPKVRAQDEREAAQLWAAIDQKFLQTVGWDDERQVLVFPQDHPLLGWNVCVVGDCGKTSERASRGLCRGCEYRWNKSGKVPLHEFVALPKPRRRRGVLLCAVPECQRPWKSGGVRLCAVHEWQRTHPTWQSVEEFLARTDLVGLPSFGPCSVVACTRYRIGRGPYCGGHGQRYLKAQLEPAFDAKRWNRTTSVVAEDGQVSLRGLHPRLIAEVIYSLQERTQRTGAKTVFGHLKALCDRARQLEATSLGDVIPDGLGLNPKKALNGLLAIVRRFGINRYRAG